MPANHEMTFVCFGVAKLECQMLNIIGYFFSFSYMPMHGLLKKQKDQNTLNMIVSVYSRRCGNYRMYLEGNSLHQAVIIMCECNWFSLVSNLHNMRHLSTLTMFSHTTCILFATFDTCASKMWFGHHKEYMLYYMLTKLS